MTEENGRTRTKRTAAKERAATLEDIDVQIAMCHRMQAEYERQANEEGAKLVVLELLRDKALQRGNGDE